MANHPQTTPSVPVSTRQAKADDTRFRLFTAGAELFSEQGYHTTSVEQIARRAGVAKGTFFLHFPTKDAVVTALVRMQVRMVKDEHARLVATGTAPVARLRAIILALGMLADRNVTGAVFTAGLDKPEVGEVLDAMMLEILGLMVEDVGAAVAVGELSRKAQPQVLANLIMDAYVGATVSYVMNPRGRSLLETLRSIIDTTLGAFATEKAKKKGSQGT